MDTIFALATAQGKAGVAVVRISGPDALKAASQFCTLPDPRRAGLRRLVDRDGAVLDEALVLVFEEGASFTGETVVEFQLHGSLAVVQAVLRQLGSVSGVRMAEPGEFTRRALENGRLDLTQVEGLGDLIDAETEAQRRQANRVLSGELGRKTDAWREDLIQAAALLELTIDFADEDVPMDVTPQVTELLNRVIVSIQQEISGYSAAERVRSGFEVAIVGAPNVGKSTLLNALAGREAAITSDIAGTTRDVIEVRMDLSGLAVTLLDTAGLRETDDMIEGLGVSLAKKRADRADLRIFVVLPGEEPLLSVQEGDLVVVGKGDLWPEYDSAVSGKSGLGLDRLLARVGDELKHRSSTAGVVTRERHFSALTDAIVYLSAAVEAVAYGSVRYDIAAEEIRSAIRRLEGLVGRVDVEDLLSDIFSRFCLGK
ncbi:tRNA uridine-5-carboxymethylaminomethyl(34) synthesis GTPase MnmE [Mesobacterium sp. TK19101]|uniref:tRNA modification GTPase MnmE n=1 Tax=Mesobacterium hydrothermale TaxID=3111907 RepID=A0ABU6HFV3_9RHOB|nr:tRNA uridine-5-carboxymethylaminomethyl(34) synthesis GTPase MnmE [Mesobacterium sp. TK19101]MEC3861345.1 tRNA uridine-5-carboxymethylaminomethyl(34) synthesis GTPase MnmE [Mesobacterium sp. TK19101]